MDAPRGARIRRDDQRGISEGQGLTRRRAALAERGTHAACDKQREIVLHAGICRQRAHRLHVLLADEIGRCAGPDSTVAPVAVRPDTATL